MSSDHEAEIRASLAAAAELGPGYDDAVAEGLVERIGAEIDKRIDARLGQFGTAGAAGPAGFPGYQGPAVPAGAQPGVPAPAGAVGPVPGPVPGPGLGVPGVPGAAGAGGAVGASGASGAAVPGHQGYQPPAGYLGYQGYVGPMLPPGYQMGPPPVRPSSIGARNVATTVTALGSIALGVGATAIVSHLSNSAGQAFMVLLIWAAIAIVNIAYARRQ